jgi:membrane-associated phospholipid phosphatase
MRGHTTSGSAAPERFFAQPRRTVRIGTALLGAVVLLALLLPSEPLRVDRRWAEAMADVESGALRQMAVVFNALGQGVWRGLTVAAVAAVLFVARRWLALAAFALVEGATPLLSTLLKAAVDRPRPSTGAIHPLGSSFPSGHAAYAGATALAVVILFTSPDRRRGCWWALATAVISAMAWSRTYLQVHWLSDVLGGALLGTGVAFLVFGSVQWWQDRRGPQARS